MLVPNKTRSRELGPLGRQPPQSHPEQQRVINEDDRLDRIVEKLHIPLDLRLEQKLHLGVRLIASSAGPADSASSAKWAYSFDRLHRLQFLQVDYVRNLPDRLPLLLRHIREDLVR